MNVMMQQHPGGATRPVGGPARPTGILLTSQSGGPLGPSGQQQQPQQQAGAQTLGQMSGMMTRPRLTALTSNATTVSLTPPGVTMATGPNVAMAPTSLNLGGGPNGGSGHAMSLVGLTGSSSQAQGIPVTLSSQSIGHGRVSTGT
ncbi:unnamed protein product [Protopolystoma xenopodis]|uniref:Uncharacterized protein n=1 Tax=Protopolystoma xenopodis TaxID=117903 RepID=A0A448WQI6_9PLAT|nr:unnamed protein product [Protopolystoma xenopodis]